MKISVICPVYNEIRFVRAHVEQALRFATEIIYYDCGSTDGTREFLAGYSRVYPNRVRLLYHRTPYHEALWEPYLWNESEVRNHLIDCCSSEWICNMDADELFPEDTLSAIPEILTTKRHFVRLGQRAFWYEPYLIRVRQADTLDHWRRFYPGGRQYRFFRNSPHVRYFGRGNHALLQFMSLGKFSPRLSMYDVPYTFHHYHWLQAPKENENRLDERGKTGVRLETYFGPHPEESRHYPWWRNG